MRLTDLIAGSDARLAAGKPEIRVCDLTEDSRTVVPGSLFIARAGRESDGRAYIPNAIEAGAVAILTDREPTPGEGARAAWCVSDDPAVTAAHLAERFYDHPSATLPVVAVTGTNGKTTVTYLTRQVLNAAGRRCGLLGGVEIDDGVGTAPAVLTTPPATEISRSLAVMLEAGCRACAMEVSSHALDQGRVAAIRRRVTVFTNLSGDHLDYHGSMDAYADAKARLFREQTDADTLAIVNADDPAHARMLEGSPARVLRCRRGTAGDRPNDSEATVAVLGGDARGTRLRLAGPWGVITGRVPIAGAHNAMNVLQAVAAAHELGAHTEAIAGVFPSLRGAPGRLERIPGEAGPCVFVDFAHTDDALAASLRTLRELLAPGGRLWCVFGCGGDRDRTKRPRMGAVAAHIAERVIVTSDNPRTEDPSAIIDDILRGVPPADRARVEVHADRTRAIRAAITHAAPADTVVIAGKGHEREQIVPDGRGGVLRVPFDDREHAADALALRHPERARVAGAP